MGCDIHIAIENKVGSKWVGGPYDFRGDGLESRSYRVFAFLAGVRNYSKIKPIAEPRGIPEDAAADTRTEYESWTCDAHSASWLSLEELKNFDYSAMMEDRRCTRNGDGGSTCAAGEGKVMSWIEYLGEYFMNSLKELEGLGAERIVFWFDN